MKTSEMTCPRCGNQTIVESKPMFSKRYLWCNHSTGFIFKSACGWDQRTDKVGLDPANLSRCPDCQRDTVKLIKSFGGKPYRACTHSGFFSKCGWDEHKAERLEKEAEAARAKQADQKRSSTPQRRERDILRCSRGCGYPAVREGMCSHHYDEWATAVIHRDSMNGRI